MESTREILTFQIGHYSNFVGAHWWNSQEAGFAHSKKPYDVDHDVLYREGWSTHHEQITFTPRLLSIDLKGSLKHLKTEGDLYEHCSGPDIHDAPWPSEKVQIDFTEEISQKNTLQKDLETKNAPAGSDYKLEEDVSVWSDYLVSRFHPRTVVVTNEFEHNSESHPFDIFSYGVNVWSQSDFKEDLLDRIRQFIEECNNAQGFQLLTDSINGFGGICAGLLEHLNDEYSNKSVLAVPLLPPVPDNTRPLQEYIHNLNFSLTLQKLAEHASLVTPLSTNGENWRFAGTPRTFPHLSYNSKLPYHTSAVLAAAIDTFSLRYRLLSRRDRLSDLVDSMSWMGRKVASCSLGLPFGISEKEYLFDMLEKWEGPLWTSVTPHCDPNIEDINKRVWMQSVVLRGVPALRLRNPSTMDHEHKSPASVLREYLAFSSHGTYSDVCSSESPCFVTPPFPSIFKPSLGVNGDVLLNGSRHETISMREVPVITSVSNSEAIGSMIHSLLKETSSLPISRFPAFSKAGLETDDYKEIRDQLLTLAENYEERET